MASSRVALRARVLGRVQGVGYRWFAEDAARRLGVTGWVRNRADRSVECHAEADPAALDLFLAALREGPAAAAVSEVRTDPAPLENAAGFSIRPTA